MPLILSILYTIFPIDLLPDILGPIGFSDDICILLVGAIKTFKRVRSGIKAVGFIESVFDFIKEALKFILKLICIAIIIIIGIFIISFIISLFKDNSDIFASVITKIQTVYKEAFDKFITILPFK
ncbi:DUF1232 domain-containing protein [Brachyspira hyodysenteriae]|nr:DUF1232 domain-containing protein [Brachyspira hyodysenteriae]MCZ9962220.1 DUF1232 domain-containing protein [Brachyspira hyodysenteriae]QTM03964.1 DUF1232 domain-containing protein [Brachyspira hyodysenteriae]